MKHGGLIVDWNNAMKIARREAGIKELLMKGSNRDVLSGSR